LPHPACEQSLGWKQAEESRVERLCIVRAALKVCWYRVGSLTRPLLLRDPATGWRELGRRGFVAQAAVPIGAIAGIRICCRDFIVGDREQKLFPHFGEASPAIFAVKQVEYGRHDRILV